MRIRVVLCVPEGEAYRPMLESSGATVVRSLPAPLRVRALEGEDLDLVLATAASLGRDPARTISAIRTLPGGPEVIALTEAEGASERAHLLAAGCMAVLQTDVPARAMGEALEALLARRRDDLTRRLRTQPWIRGNRLEDFASNSLPMRRLLETARRVVPSAATLLILGETGVGKEWLARAIHEEGPRAKGPFVAINCGALPETLLESELFGHERGAFTGASRSHRGHFEMAHRGTVFLDEIGEMPPHLQVKLLRVLQERCIQRLGGEHPVEVDVRVMAATHRNPTELRARGLLREDLYFRLAVVTLAVPPLRARIEDLPTLAETHLERFATTLGRPARAFSESALEALRRYGWPGNLRELVNVVERCVLLSGGAEIVPADLPEEIARAAGTPAGPAPDAPGGGGEEREDELPFQEARSRVVRRFERDYLVALLDRAGGRVGEAALRAGLNPRSLYDLLRRHDIRWRDHRFPARR